MITNSKSILNGVKEKGCPFVVIFPFGDQIVTVIITKEVKVQYTIKSKFM